MKKEPCKKPCKECKCDKPLALKNPTLVSLPLEISMPSIPSSVFVDENKGDIKIVLRHLGREIQLFADKNGFHIGSILDGDGEQHHIKTKADVKAKRVR